MSNKKLTWVSCVHIAGQIEWYVGMPVSLLLDGVAFPSLTVEVPFFIFMLICLLPSVPCPFCPWFLVILLSNDFSWEFTGTDEEGAKSIPYQLQRLFLQLQVLFPVLHAVSLSFIVCLFLCNIRIWFDAYFCINSCFPGKSW